jgi:DDE superfamily endonuclease
MIDPATFVTLRQFRAGVYQRFEARRDALFEVLDAATVAGLVPSLAHLSLSAVHRRRWGSLYDALAAGSMDAAALRELVAGYPLDDGQPIYALDTSVWPPDDAETSPERGHYFSSSRQSAGQPIVTGWSYA